MASRPQPKFNTTRRMRLKGYNYSTPGYYFITICQRDRQHLFADISASGHQLSAPGEMVAEIIAAVGSRFLHTQVDASVVMPNHVHMLLGMKLTDSDETFDSVIDVMHWWKTQTTNRYGWGVTAHGWPQYHKSLWQEGYHDRIVRDQRELEYIRHYIEQNPYRWQEDSFFDDP